MCSGSTRCEHVSGKAYYGSHANIRTVAEWCRHCNKRMLGMENIVYQFELLTFDGRIFWFRRLERP